MILNYKYGLFPPADWDDICEREIHLQDLLWNRLVAIELGYREDVENTVRQHALYCELAEQSAALGLELEIVLTERRARRKAARAKLATPELDARIEDLAARRRKMWPDLKKARTAAFKAYREDLRPLADKRYDDITTARQNSGLWWSNYNAVIASFDGTLRRIKPWQNPRALGEEGRLSGRLTVQIQQGCAAPAFLAGARSEAKLDMDEAQWIKRGKSNWRPRRAVLTATVRTDQRVRKTASWPVLMHRPLPPGAVIKSLTITRRRPVPSARQWKWEATFSVDIPDALPARVAAIAGVDLGWRKIESGLRVATIATSVGGVEHVILPGDMLDRRARIAGLMGRVVEESRELGADPVKHEDWRRLSLEIARWNRRRRDIYRVAAADLINRCQLVGLDGSGIAAMAADKRMPPETRRMRTWAAPAEFGAAVRDAGRRHGVKVEDIEGPSTLVCHICAHKNVVSEATRLDLIWRCAGCGSLWDQDENAARNCLKVVQETRAPSGDTVTLKGPAERRKPPRLTRKREEPRAPGAAR